MKVRWILVGVLCLAWLPTAAGAAPRVAASALPSAALPQDRDHPDWDHDRRFEGRNPGFKQGFQDGFEDGRRDRDAGRRLHYGPGWKHPDRGYRGEFGDRHDYEREYRDGYEKGYHEAYDRR
jgi:hypothetical protein